MIPDEARYEATNADAGMGSVELMLERLESALGYDTPILLEIARLARLEARELHERVHALRRRIEATG